jgi:hypothetical protein
MIIKLNIIWVIIFSHICDYMIKVKAHINGQLDWWAPKLLVNLKDEPNVENNGKIKSSKHAP